MAQGTLLVPEPCENKATNFPPGELRVWCLSPWIQSTRQQRGSLYVTCGWHLDKPSANSNTKIHCVRVTGELGRASKILA